MNDYDDVFKSICRLCLSRSDIEKMVSLFDNTNKDGLSCYGKSVVIVTNISLQKDNELPYMMCQKCVYLLKHAIRFKLTCESANQKLKRMLKSDVNKDCPEQNVKEKVCDYVMYTQYFSKETHEQTSETFKQQKYSIKVNHLQAKEDQIPVSESLEKSTDNTNHTFDFDDFIDNEECEKSNENQERNSNKIDNILNTMQDIINLRQRHLIFNRQKIIKMNRPNVRKTSNTYYQQKDSFNVNHSQAKEERISNTENVEKYTDNTNHIHDDSVDYIDNEECSKTNGNQEENPNEILNTIHDIINTRQRKHVFKRRTILKRNIPPVRKNERNLICKICHKILANRLTFSNHMQRHNMYRYICDQCAKGFPNLTELHMHQIAKHGIGPYLQCDHCPYKAPRKTNLIEHLRLHTGERPFTCEKCGLTFRRKAIWRNHLLYHTDKTHQCMYCPKKFYRRCQMLAHCNNVHVRLYMYMCSICSITYTKTETVRRHMIIKHGIPKEKQGRIIKVPNSNNELLEKIN